MGVGKVSTNPDHRLMEFLTHPNKIMKNTMDANQTYNVKILD